MVSSLHSVFIFIAAVIGETFGNLFGGGSFFIQPVLLLAGISPHIAIANDVAAAGVSALTFVALIHRQGYVHWRAVLVMAPAALMGGIIGVNVMKEIPAAFLQCLLVVICIGGIALMVHKLFHPHDHLASLEGKEDGFHYRRGWQIMAALAALFLGVYDGVSGAGSGVLLIIMLALIFNACFKAAVATLSLSAV